MAFPPSEFVGKFTETIILSPEEKTDFSVELSLKAFLKLQLLFDLEVDLCFDFDFLDLDLDLSGFFDLRLYCIGDFDLSLFLDFDLLL